MAAIAWWTLILLLPQPIAFAQAAPAPIEHLEVALWPEFDRAAMLVIYRFEISPESSLPATVDLPIPPDVGQPYAVAWQDNSGELFDTSYSMGADGMVSISLSQGSQGQLEYYADLSFQDELRNYRFEWPGTVALGGLSYEVQLPLGAGSLSVSPPPEAQAPGPFGLTYAEAELGPQPLGSEAAIELSYLKSDSNLTLPSIQAQNEPLAPSAARVPASSELLPWLLAGGGVVLVGAGLIYYLRGRATSLPRPRRRSSEARASELELSVIYCHQCGTKTKVNDRFCRNCGAALRRP